VARGKHLGGDEVRRSVDRPLRHLNHIRIKASRGALVPIKAAVLRSKPCSAPLDLRSEPAAALWRCHATPVQFGCRLPIREPGQLDPPSSPRSSRRAPSRVRRTPTPLRWCRRRRRLALCRILHRQYPQPQHAACLCAGVQPVLRVVRDAWPDADYDPAVRCRHAGRPANLNGPTGGVKDRNTYGLSAFGRARRM
jgi:hypothetical protein